MNNKEAVIVVDYQNDFADKESGNLYVPDGEKIAENINNIMGESKSRGGIIIASKELHKNGHISFASSFKNKEPITTTMKKGESPNKNNFITLEEIKTWTQEKNGLNKNAGFTIEELKAYLKINGNIQALWPDHCVDGTSGAEFYKDLDLSLIDVEVKKGFQANNHPYSAFGGYSMDEKITTIEILKNAGIKLLKIVGLATDYCAMETAVDGKINGFDVEYFYKASAGVSAASTVEALDKMRNMGIKILS